jgi:hypothetical protein
MNWGYNAYPLLLAKEWNAMTIKLENIRVGDEITLKPMKVIDNDGTDCMPIRATCDGGSSNWYELEDIATHTPKPREFKAGDEVRYVKRPNVRYFVIATYGVSAWVRDRNDWTVQIPFAELRHADEAD